MSRNHGFDQQESPDEPMSKRRHGCPSETRVKRGERFVHGDKELL